MFNSTRREYRALAKAGDIDGLINAYRALDESDHAPRIDALGELSRADPAAATPLLREVLATDSDSMVVLMILDRIDKYKIVGTSDEVGRLTDDSRTLVAKQARHVAKRLAKVG